MSDMNKEIDYDNLEREFFEALHKEVDMKDGEIPLVEFTAKSFLLYGASTIVGRAIPCVYDGLKTGQRRLLFTMKDSINLTHTGSYKKSARVVGDCIGKYHPHGDTASYDTLVNLTQNWKRMLPLADGQGNWGSIDGSNAAAMRYTETRMTLASSLLFSDLDYDTVDFVDNYDGTEKEPRLLPAPYPNILINGAPQGSIATGLTSSILPHNPDEVMQAMIRMIELKKEGKEMSPEEFLSFVPAPDFPTGGYVYHTDKMEEIVRTGRGSVRVRAKHHIEKGTRGRHRIVVTEIPYGETRTRLISKVVELKKEASKNDKMAQAITYINDESDKNGMRIVIETKNGFDPEVVWNYIAKNTPFDSSINYTSVVLIEELNSKGEKVFSPKPMGLLEMLEHYLAFRFQTYERKHTYLIGEYESRMHILEGLLKAIGDIDNIIKTIRKSESQNDARARLEAMGYSDRQAQAIVAMRLGRLTKLPREEFETEFKELTEKRDYSKKILEDFNFMCDQLIKESEKIRSQIAFPRKTEIRNELGGMNMEDLIPQEDCIIYLTRGGYLKRVPERHISSQNRGTKGKRGIELNEDDFVERIYHTNTHSMILFVMESGQVYGTKAYNIPETSRGAYFANIFEGAEEESIVSVLEVPELDKGRIVFVTERGIIKSTATKEFGGSSRKGGVRGITLKEGDRVVSVRLLNEEAERTVFIATEQAKSIRFPVDQIPTIGRSGSGVIAIRLKENDRVVGACIVKEDEFIGTVTEEGMIKVSPAKDFRIQNRGGVGVICMSLTKKSGHLITVLCWEDGDEHDVVTITEKGVTNRIPIKDIRITSRTTKGVKLVEVPKGDRLSFALKVEREEEEEEENE